MQLETYLGLVVIGISIAAWSIRKYMTIMADGKITLDEIIDTVEEVVEIIDDVTNIVDELSE